MPLEEARVLREIGDRRKKHLTTDQDLIDIKLIDILDQAGKRLEEIGYYDKVGEKRMRKLKEGEKSAQGNIRGTGSAVRGNAGARFWTQFMY
jgi:hypothetical protein